MLDLLKRLCETDGASGNEERIRDIIISEIDGFCDWRIDNLGNIIAFKKGKKTPQSKLLIDAHMDEVGVIISAVTNDGFLRFKTVGGMNISALMFRNVLINGCLHGVISGKPVHLLEKGEKEKLPKEDSLYIDIGTSSKEEALRLVSLGDFGVLESEWNISGDNILSKALDDRIGCAILVWLLKQDAEYDFYASFSVQEELGLRGAKTATFQVMPDSAIILEGTTALDISDTPSDQKVCSLGEGAAISFMDNSTLYYRPYFDEALKSGIKCQVKAKVSGGNNSGAIHLTGKGVKTIAISVPCRYIHSSCSVANTDDIKNAKSLCEYMMDKILSGEAK